MSNPTQLFAIRGEATDTLEIDVYDDIGESFWGGGVTAKAVRRALKNASKARTIKLRVNSRGGDVFDGFAIYNLLVDHPARVEADVDALAASMASVILMAAEEIRVAQGAMIMIHNPIALAFGEADDLRGTAELLDKVRDQIADAYVSRTGLGKDRIHEMMDAETWLTPEEAKANGFADVVKPAQAGPAKARALAAIDLRGFERPPSQFAEAVESARRARPAPQPPTAPQRVPEPPRGAEQQTKEATAERGRMEAHMPEVMNLKTLRAQYPDLIEAAVKEGVDQERKRVSAHLKLGKTTGAMDVAEKAIASGVSTLDEEIHAEYLAAGMNRRERDARQIETDDAGAAADGAARDKSQPENLEDQVMALVEKQLGRKEQ